MRYLTVADIEHINEVEVGGGLLADFGLLESAVLRPQTTVMGVDAYPTVDAKAAALFHSLVRNHAFIDGNKRTAVLALVLFYGLNGLALEMETDELLALAIDVAEGLLDVPSIIGQIKSKTVPMMFPEDDAYVEDEEGA